VKGRTRTFLIYLITAVFSFFLGLFILDQVILPHLAGAREEVQVPKMEGLSLSQAQDLCRESGLGLTVQGETYQAAVPAGHVLKQDPETGARVKQGRQVYVLLSLGPEMVTVPHVRNLTQRQAEILVERSRLKLAGVRRVSDPNAPKDRVIDITPAEGSALPDGGEVQLTVSIGVEQVQVPSVIDKPLAEAEQVLNAAGLKLGKVSYRFNRFIAEGHVIDQAPLERVQVNVGATVDVVLSSAQP
jgi:eukaryotic-like serine/threonine-protein kinase